MPQSVLHRLSRCLALVSVLAFGMPAIAQQFPNRPLRLIVPFAPGGGTDLVGRVLADSMGKQLGQPVVVDNRGGAGTAIGSDAVAKSAPDGYTLLLNGGSMIYLGAFVPKLPFNVEKDFRRVTVVSQQPLVLTVNKDLPAKDLAEFIALAKSRPDKLSYASAGIGSATHMESELLWHEIGARLLHVPYKGTAPAVSDLLAGNVQVMYTTLAAAAELIRSNKVSALAVSSDKRSPVFPDIPTVAESMKSNFAQASTLSLFVPAATPLPIAERLLAATKAAITDPALQARFSEQGLTPLVSQSLSEAEDYQRKEVARWNTILQSMGLKAN